MQELVEVAGEKRQYTHTMFSLMFLVALEKLFLVYF